MWERNLGAEFGPYDISHGHGSSPVIYKDTLILLSYHPSASYLLALDSGTGETRWKLDREGRTISYSTPKVIETADRAEVVVNSNHGMSGHDASTGRAAYGITKKPIGSRFPPRSFMRA